MQIHIVVVSPEGSQRVLCEDGVTAALEVARILNRESGREVHVTSTNDDGSTMSLLCLGKRSKPPPRGNAEEKAGALEA